MPAGLVQFPITKSMMVGTVGVALAASLFDTKYWFLLQYEPFVSEYLQYWRFLTFQMGSINESDVALITLVWYQFKPLERLFGSRKYLNLIILSWIYTTLMTFVLSNSVNIFLLRTWWNEFTNGPLPVILCLTHFYKQYVPRIYEFNVILNQPFLAYSRTIKWKLTDHFLVNGLIFLCMINQGLPGLGIGLLSWICGVLLDRGLLPGLESFQLAPFKDAWNRSPSTKSTPTMLSSSNMSNGELNEEELDNPQDEPERPLGVQFLDTFRR